MFCLWLHEHYLHLFSQKWWGVLGRQVCQTQRPCWQAIHRLGRDALRKIARFFVFLGVINCCNKIVARIHMTPFILIQKMSML